MGWLTIASCHGRSNVRKKQDPIHVVIGLSKLKPKEPHWNAPDRAAQPRPADARSGALVGTRPSCFHVDATFQLCRVSDPCPSTVAFLTGWPCRVCKSL